MCDSLIEKSIRKIIFARLITIYLLSMYIIGVFTKNKTNALLELIVSSMALVCFLFSCCFVAERFRA